MTAPQRERPSDVGLAAGSWQIGLRRRGSRAHERRDDGQP